MLKAARKRRHYRTAHPRIVGRRADTVLANIWLAEGAPIADVLTMLETRHRFDLSAADCRAYAVEILWAAQQQVEALEDYPKLNPKETKYALA